MAKKPKTTAAPDDEAEEGAPAPKRSRKTLMIFGAAGFALLAAAAGGGYFMFGGSKTDAAEIAKATPKKITFVDIREMIVNLASEPNQERPKLLKFKVALEVQDPKIAADIQPLLPRIEDAFQVFVRELRAADLEGSRGVYHLREELLRRVNMAVYPAKVDAVLFKDIIVQ